MSENTTNKIDVVAHLHAGAGNEALFREVLEAFVGPTRQEQGCIRYDLFQDVTDPAQFTFIEEWATAADLDRHSKSEHIVAGRARIAGKEAEVAWVQVVRRIL
jgi:quinol monooxygenase YgiN